LTVLIMKPIPFHKPSLVACVALLLCVQQPVAAAEVTTAGNAIHVSPAGDDAHPGTVTQPLATLAAAQRAARALAGRQPLTVWLHGGSYYLTEPIQFTAPDSGTAEAPVVYAAAPGERPVISGGTRLDLDWVPYRDGIFSAQVPAGLHVDQLFINGQRQRMARYPNYDPDRPTAPYQGYAADAFSKERAAGWANPVGGYIHAMHRHEWGGYHYRITGKDADGTVDYEGGWQNNRQLGMHREFRMVENIYEELDAPGEWFHDANANSLFFMPLPGTDLAQATVEVVRLRHLVEFDGSAETPVRHITLKGITFRHTARTFMDTREPLLRSDWTLYRGGAVLLTGTEDIGLLDCEFDQVGGNAIFVNRYNRRTLIQGCHIHDSGASGVCFVGDPAAVRDPLFEYGQTQDLTRIDRTPGPKSIHYPADGVVADCLIHGIGRIERQSAGVQISMSSRITVRDTSIYDCARAGINISEGTWGGHLIERCDVFDTVLETGDHGSFNSWGRDRFWTSNHRVVSEPEVKRDPTLPYLDAIEPTIIRDSRWRCDHGWDIDLDDGSSHYEIYNNLMLAGGLKFREGYGRTAHNNILIHNGFHPHVWFDDSDSAFHRNIVMKPHAPIGQPHGWGRLVDHNLFLTEADRARHLDSGADAHSLVGDPRFVDPAAGDFRVQDGSPALKLGFKNFPMDQFGVKKPALKAIARTPEIPQLILPEPKPEGRTPGRRLFWLGAALHGLEGEEFSAFGVSREDGGVQLVEVPAVSSAAQAGFEANDLIQSINGDRVSNTTGLFTALARAGSEPIQVRLIRNQKPVELTLSTAPFFIVESSEQAGGFSKLPLPVAADATVTANQQTHNQPTDVLTDGKLAADYGPVFANGVRDGAYKIDLGSAKPVAAVTSWSFNQNGNRGRQVVTLFGSRAEADPGWETRDGALFVPLASMDTVLLPASNFTAVSLRATTGGSLGPFRWLIWECAPATDDEENTAWQEFSVD
jgi:hypothetical protein